MNITAQIIAKHFVAAIQLNEHDFVTHHAPILQYMSGWTEQQVRDYCEKKGWKYTIVEITKEITNG